MDSGSGKLKPVSDYPQAGPAEVEGRRLRVAMVGLRGIPHSYGGGEEFAGHVAPLLVEAGLDVTVYCRRGLFTDRSATWRGVRRVFLPTVEHKWLGQFIHGFLACLWASFAADVVYIHTLPSAPWSILPRLARKKIVINVDGLDWERAKWGSFARRYFIAAREIAMRTADRIVNDSKVLQKYYLETFGKDSDFIAYGADLTYPQQPKRVKALGLEPGQYYLIASRLIPENNAEMIIRAFNRLETARTLAIAGTANYRSDWLSALFAEAGSRVKFLGHVSDPDVMTELHCNCFAYLHGHTMGGTNPSLLKALGAGNCVVAYDSPFNVEVLTCPDGTMYGEFFHDDEQLFEVLRRLEASPELVAALRARARDRITAAYTWEAVAARYAALFRRLESVHG